MIVAKSIGYLINDISPLVADVENRRELLLCDNGCIVRTN